MSVAVRMDDTYLSDAKCVFWTGSAHDMKLHAMEDYFRFEVDTSDPECAEFLDDSEGPNFVELKWSEGASYYDAHHGEYCSSESYWTHSNSYTDCPAGYYCPGKHYWSTDCWATGSNDWDGAPKIACPSGTTSPFRSVEASQCVQVSECSAHCPANHLDDDFCDSNCDTAACNYDEGDCISSSNCASGCIQGWPGDGVCDLSCFNAECGFDDGDCDNNCADNCPPHWPGDNICDTSCNVAACNFDDGDCDSRRMDESDTESAGCDSLYAGLAVSGGLTSVTFEVSKWGFSKEFTLFKDDDGQFDFALFEKPLASNMFDCTQFDTAQSGRINSKSEFVRAESGVDPNDIDNDEDAAEDGGGDGSGGVGEEYEQNDDETQFFSAASSAVLGSASAAAGVVGVLVACAA